MSGQQKSPRSWWEDTLRGRQRGFMADSVRRAARWGSWAYALGIRSRDAAYARGWFSVRRLPRPTVCVGNITVGGTGKTPLVIRLTRDLLDAGLRPAVLLRGYKRENTDQETVIVRSPSAVLASVTDSGDEAMEIARRLPGSVVVVGANRYRSGRRALSEFPIDCFVMDDGFQHHALARDFNVVALDSSDPWGGGQLLPAGLLREPPVALDRANFIVLTRASTVSFDRLRVLKHEVQSLTHERTPLLESLHAPEALIDLKNGSRLELSALQGRSVVSATGIGVPELFDAALRQAGATIVHSLHLPDHGGEAESVWQWVKANRPAGAWVILTEKDAARWDADEAALPAHCYVLRMNVEFRAGETHWKKLVRNLVSACQLPPKNSATNQK